MNRKWKVSIIAVSAVIIVSLISLLVIVPRVFGEEFVSSSFELAYIYETSSSHQPGMEVVYINGSVVPVVWIGLTANVTNSYIVPVEVRYNGFEFVWLIYNQTVTDPTDVVGNKDYLVWGAFYAGYHIGFYNTYGFYGGSDWINETGYESGYDYYVAHKDLTNYTKTISVGTDRYPYVFEASSTSPPSAWAGQTINPPHTPVPPGTYHIYCIAYGKVSQLINLTVTSVLWH